MKKDNREHSFDFELAELIGVEKAILMKNISFWCEENQRRRISMAFKNGTWWTAESLTSLSKKYKYMKRGNLSRWLHQMQEDKWILMFTGEKGSNFYAVGPVYVAWNLDENWEQVFQNETGRCFKMKQQVFQNEIVNKDIEKGNIEKGNIEDSPQKNAGSLFTDDFTDIPKEKKPQTSKPKSEGNKKTSPGAGWTSKAVDSFNRVLIECQEGTPEHERLTFNWRAAEGRNFQSLKKIREAMGPDMRTKLNRELLEDDFEKGFEFLFRYGFQYMKKIADEKGGPIQFSPASILNNYNSILQYARTGHKNQQPKLRPGEIDRDTFYTELVRESLAMDYK